MTIQLEYDSIHWMALTKAIHTEFHLSPLPPEKIDLTSPYAMLYEWETRGTTPPFAAVRVKATIQS